jgi:hypothetical protein
MIIIPFAVTNLAGTLLSGCTQAGPHGGPPNKRCSSEVAGLRAVKDDGP